MPTRRWVRVTTDGVVFSGPCLVHNIIFAPTRNDEYVDVYDGRDATAGKLFCRLLVFREQTHTVSLGQGAPFDIGIYVALENAGDAVTIVFTPLGE